MFEDFPNIDTTAVCDEISIPCLLVEGEHSLAVMDSVQAHYSSLKFYTVKENEYRHLDRREGTPHPFALHSQSWVTLVFVLQFFIYTYSAIRFRKFWTEQIKGLIHTKERMSFFADSSLRDNNQITYLSGLAFVNLAIFLYLFIAKIHPNPIADTAVVLCFVAVVSIFLLFRYCILKFLGYVFFAAKNVVGLYRNSLFVTTSVFGILLYINDLLLIYSPLAETNVLFVTGLVLFIFLIAFKSYLILIFFYSQLNSFLYFILYLCALEILPVALLFQVLVEVERTNLITEWILRL